LHIYDSYRRELLTLIFKVNIPVVGDPPTTMTLPDSEVLALDDHRRKYSISIGLCDLLPFKVVFMVQATRLCNLICGLGNTCGLSRGT
jgi:hypothetical protein